MSSNGLPCFTCACIISDSSDTGGVTESTAATGMAPRTLFSKPAPSSNAAVAQSAAAAGFSKPVQAMPSTTSNSVVARTAGASSATPNLFGSLAFNKSAPTTAPTSTAFAGLGECYSSFYTRNDSSTKLYYSVYGTVCEF